MSLLTQDVGSIWGCKPEGGRSLCLCFNVHLPIKMKISESSSIHTRIHSHDLVLAEMQQPREAQEVMWEDQEPEAGAEGRQPQWHRAEV